MRFGGIFLVTAALLLSACSGEPEPKEPTTTPKPAPTSTATLPAMPDQAKEDGANGAAAFAAHWIRVSNFAAETGDVEELKRLSSPDCEGCERYIELYRSTYAAGGYFRGGEWVPGDARVAKTDLGFIVKTKVTWEESRFRTSSDEQEDVGEAGGDELTFDIRDGRVHQVASGVE